MLEQIVRRSSAAGASAAALGTEASTSRSP